MIKVKRSIFVGVRFQPEEYEFLCEKAEKDPETRMRTGSKNLSAYQFRKIGTNINQATKQLHIGYEPAAAADRLEKNMKLLEQQFEKMKEELKQTYGNHEDIKH